MFKECEFWNAIKIMLNGRQGTFFLEYVIPRDQCFVL